jgi:hypothetical protein
VHDALRVRRGHGIGDLDGVPECFAKAQPMFRDGLIESDPFNELHNEVVRADVMNRADARMIERRDAARFAREAVTEPAGRELERDHPVEPCIARGPDFAHPAGADALDELIRPDQLARSHRGDGRAVHAAAMVANTVTGSRTTAERPDLSNMKNSNVQPSAMHQPLNDALSLEP